MLASITGWTDKLHRSALAFPLVLLAAALLVGISELGYHEAEGQLNRLITMGKVRLEITRVLRRVTDAESGQRGYLLTQRDDHLLPYRDASRDAQDSLGRLQVMYKQLGDDPSQLKLNVLAGEVRTKLSELDEVLALRAAGRNEPAQALMLSGIGQEKMESIRRRADGLLDAENQRVAAGLSNVFDTLALNRIGVAAMSAISLLALGMFLRQSRVVDQQRLERQSQMAAERDRLEALVLARTAELTELARHLETAREDERARLARDLHDELGALLTAAKLDVARIRPRVQEAAPEALPRIGHLVETLNSGIALKRRIIEDLRPSTLNTLGLQPALEILCRESGERMGVEIDTHFEPVRLSASAELTIFRMVQEGLNNVSKYAEPTRVEVMVEDLGTHARVTVKDDGLGFDPADVGPTRHGLVGMRYRIEAEGGQLTLQSAPEKGVTLSAVLPQVPAGLTDSSATSDASATSGV